MSRPWMMESGREIGSIDDVEILLAELRERLVAQLKDKGDVRIRLM